MNSIIAFLAVQCLVALVMIAVWVLPPRLRMERRARRLLSVHPNAQGRSVYLSFPGVMGKRALMDARIAEIEADGWTFLRATEANPWRTVQSWGGGLTLHFIRAPMLTEHRSRPRPNLRQLRIDSIGTEWVALASSGFIRDSNR